MTTGADAFAFRIVGCHDCLVANNTYWSPAPKAILWILHDAFASQGGTGCDNPLHNSNVRITNTSSPGRRLRSGSRQATRTRLAKD